MEERFSTIAAVDHPCEIGDVVELSFDPFGERIEYQPALVLRKSNHQEYVAFHKSIGCSEERINRIREDSWHFYAVSTD
jgi:hypothetical protein